MSARRLISKLKSVDDDKSSKDSFEQDFYWTPPVRIMQGMSQPTVIQWLRRRGPKLHNSVLQKLFRKRRVKAYFPSNDTVSRTNREQLLEEGCRVLLPKDVITDSMDPRTRPDFPQLREELVKGVQKDLHNRILYQDEDVIILNKPAGLAVQGGKDIRMSMDVLAAQFLSQHDISPKLVHRLDKDVSGCLVMARNSDSAHWLSEAFRHVPPIGKADSGNNDRLIVQKSYVAIVEHGQKEIPETGAIKDPIKRRDDEPKGYTASLTEFRVLARGGKSTVMGLRPITGRKHQLRIHCAESLGAPILGDTQYGGTARPQLMTFQRKDPRTDVSATFRKLRSSLLLHCHELALTKGSQVLWKAKAPVPTHFKDFLQQNRWSKELQDL